nr:cysteine desulfurase family protein [uncultured Cohaesibacter sp.]
MGDSGTDGDGTVYLDHQASSIIDPSVLNVMVKCWEDCYANPHSSDHVLGWKSNAKVEDARRKISNYINCDKEEIVFTSGATESNNFIIRGILSKLKKIGRMKIISTSIEHKCVLACLEYAAGLGFEVVLLSPDREGLIDPTELEKVMDDGVGLVSVMAVNNEIGTVQPIKELAKVAHAQGALFHSDAAQAPIIMEIDCADLDIDMMSFSGHKVCGPKGIGAAFVRREIKDDLEALILGGGQEGGLRSGTLPTPLCVGLGEAFRVVASNVQWNREKLGSLSRLFLEGLMERIPDVEVNGSMEVRHPGNLNIRFPSIKARDLIQVMQPLVAASTGSACSSGIEAPSYVLNEIGLSTTAAAECIRFSFGIRQSADEILQAVIHVHDSYMKIRKREDWCLSHSH